MTNQISSFFILGGFIMTTNHDTYIMCKPFYRLTKTGDVSPYTDLFKLQNRTLTVGKSKGFLNFEMYPVFSVVVKTTDSGTPPLSYTGVIRIVLQNVNDQPKNISLSNKQV
jgi:hypothetical protein